MRVESGWVVRTCVAVNVKVKWSRKAQSGPMTRSLSRDGRSFSVESQRRGVIVVNGPQGVDPATAGRVAGSLHGSGAIMRLVSIRLVSAQSRSYQIRFCLRSSSPSKFILGGDLESLVPLSYHTTTRKMAATDQDTQVPTLRKVLVSETEPLARRFRALFSLKHVASLQPPSPQSVPAIEAIAAAFGSPSALLKHELAYCLGQSRHDAAIAPLRGVLEDKEEDSMCRHEAAEALAALGDKGSLPLLKELRDDVKEVDVVRETCDIAVDRLEWEHGLQKDQEQLKKRYDLLQMCEILCAESG